MNRQNIGYIALDAAVSLDFFRSVRRKPMGASRRRMIISMPSRCWTGCPMELEDCSTDRIAADNGELQRELDAEFQRLIGRAS